MITNTNSLTIHTFRDAIPKAICKWYDIEVCDELQQSLISTIKQLRHSEQLLGNYLKGKKKKSINSETQFNKIEPHL